MNFEDSGNKPLGPVTYEEFAANVDNDERILSQLKTVYKVNRM